MGIILLVLLLALILGGLGFAIHILWWIALVVLVIWLIGFVVRVGEGTSRRRWYRWLQPGPYFRLSPARRVRLRPRHEAVVPGGLSGKGQGMAGERQDSRWVIRPSLWFDAVCLVPLLAGLPFYTSRHEHDARCWQERLASAAGRPARDAVGVLRDEVADRAAKPLPAFLALWTSPAARLPEGAAEDLDGLIAAVADPELLTSAMRERSARWNEPDDRLFRSVRLALLAVLDGLRAAGLAQWWAEHAADDLRRRCAELSESFGGYDLVPLVEQHTGVRFEARAVELCVLRWAAPHGIRVTGTRFLTDIRYDADRVLNIAVHELLHRPWPAGHPIKGRLDALAADPFLAARFAGRDPAAGYNTWAGYAEEDAAQALDQFLNDQLGRNTRGDPVTRWTEADSGMHVLALLLHDTVRRGAFNPVHGSYADFLARALSDPDTWPRDLQARYLELTARLDHRGRGSTGRGW
jgi:hypothetical protein